MIPPGGLAAFADYVADLEPDDLTPWEVWEVEEFFGVRW